MRGEQVLTNHCPFRKGGVHREPAHGSESRFLILDLDADPAQLRAAVARLAAELRPAPGPTNSGLTPKWMRDRIAILDALRNSLPAVDDAAEVSRA